MKDQMDDMKRRDVSVGFIDAESEETVKKEVMEGNYSIVLLSPEMIIDKWRSLLLSNVYQERLVGVVIDIVL
jgi:superfamily II DNA helicase RecQ